MWLFHVLKIDDFVIILIINQNDLLLGSKLANWRLICEYDCDLIYDGVWGKIDLKYSRHTRGDHCEVFF